MQNATNAVLDRVASTLGLRSDYAIAKAMHQTTQSLSKYRLGKSQLGEESALKAAELAHLNPGAVLAKLQAERAKSPEVRKVWETLAALAESAGLPKEKSPA